MSGTARIGVSLLVGIALVGIAFASWSRPLTILHTNDLHLRFARLDSLRELIEEERAKGAPVLLVDAGDTWQDFRRPSAMVGGADDMVEWMNGVGYDAMALGNHDLYWGPDRLFELVDQAGFAVLCANLEPAGGFATPFASSVVRSIAGIRVLLIGVITDQYLPHPDYPWLRHVEPGKAIVREIDKLAEPADLIVAVGHVPIDEAVRITTAVSSIDLFVTGHSHEETREPVRAGKTLIVQTGAFARNLGRLVLDVGAEGTTLVSYDLLETEKAPTQWGRGLLQFAAVAVALLATALLVLL